MASATRVQMWTYAVLLLLATLLATLLGTAVAEAASTPADKGEWPTRPSDARHAELALPPGRRLRIRSRPLLLPPHVVSCALIPQTHASLITRQLQPDSQLVWFASDCAAITLLSIFGFGCAIAFTARGVLDLGSCSASTASYCRYVMRGAQLMPVLPWELGPSCGSAACS